MGTATNKLDTLCRLLAEADNTYAQLPSHLRLQVAKISQGLAEFGPRKLHRRGPGTEFFQAREFNPAVDEKRLINARLSARANKHMVIEKEAETRQHFYLWRDPTGSMDYASAPRLHTKKQAAEVMLLALAKHLAKNEDMIGLVDRKGVYRGGRAAEWAAQKMDQATIITGDMPALARRLPLNSTVILFSDFLMPPETLAQGLAHLSGSGLRGFMIKIADPQEINFDFKGDARFRGLEGESPQKLSKVESLRAAYQQRWHEHMRQVEDMCRTKGFQFILQRTDKPLHDALLSIYGIKPPAPKSPAPAP